MLSKRGMIKWKMREMRLLSGKPGMDLDMDYIRKETKQYCPPEIYGYITRGEANGK